MPIVRPANARRLPAGGREATDAAREGNAPRRNGPAYCWQVDEAAHRRAQAHGAELFRGQLARHGRAAAVHVHVHRVGVQHVPRARGRVHDHRHQAAQDVQDQVRRRQLAVDHHGLIGVAGAAQREGVALVLGQLQRGRRDAAVVPSTHTSAPAGLLLTSTLAGPPLNSAPLAERLIAATTRTIFFIKISRVLLAPAGQQGAVPRTLCACGVTSGIAARNTRARAPRDAPERRLSFVCWEVVRKRRMRAWGKNGVSKAYQLRRRYASDSAEVAQGGGSEWMRRRLYTGYRPHPGAGCFRNSGPGRTEGGGPRVGSRSPSSSSIHRDRRNYRSRQLFGVPGSAPRPLAVRSPGFSGPLRCSVLWR